MDLQKTVLCITAHPDDEAIGAGATLLALRDAGYQIVIFACTLGSRGQEQRRKAELVEACRHGDFHLEIASPLTYLSNGDNFPAEEGALSVQIAALCKKYRPAIVLAPHPHDAHPAHEAVARASRRGMESSGLEVVWWMWHIWSDLAYPTLYVPFDNELMRRLAFVLDAHLGELERNAFHRLAKGSAMAQTVLGSEKIFGYGSGMVSPLPYAELFTEVVYRQGDWLIGAGRVLDPASPFVDPLPFSLTWWLNAPSAASRLALRQHQSLVT